MSAYGNHPAFPNESAAGRYFGLTKRELIAAMAMQGMDLGPHSYSPADLERKQPEKDAEKVAMAAVRIADALIAELAKDGAA